MRVRAGKVVPANPLLIPLLFAFNTMLTPAQQRRIYHICLQEKDLSTQRKSKRSSWLWPGSGEGTHTRARLIRQKQEQKKGWERNVLWRRNHGRLLYLLGKGLEPCGERAVGINVTLIYSGTLFFFSLSFVQTHRDTILCTAITVQNSKDRHWKYDSGFWISGLEIAVKLQKSSHPGGDDAWLSLLRKIWDGALFWVHPNGLWSIKVLTYIHCLLRSNSPLFWSP